MEEEVGEIEELVEYPRLFHLWVEESSSRPPYSCCLWVLRDLQPLLLMSVLCDGTIIGGLVVIVQLNDGVLTPLKSRVLPTSSFETGQNQVLAVIDLNIMHSHQPLRYEPQFQPKHPQRQKVVIPLLLLAFPPHPPLRTHQASNLVEPWLVARMEAIRGRFQSDDG